MAALQIGLIQGTAAFSTTNRSGNTNPAGPNFTLWSNPTPPANEGPDGSANCCTFNLPAAMGAQIPISVSGNAPILASTATFVLQGLWNNIVVFQTTPLLSPMTAPFTVPINQFLLAVNPPLLPFRLAGNWTWKIGPPGGDLVSSGPILLEINFVAAPPPSGPLDPPDGISARPDFQGVYPVDLFRLFLPSLSEVPSGVDLKNWYMARSIRTIWELGLAVNPQTAGTRTIQYETIRGAPAYIDGSLGGVFQLRRFVRTMFATVNCYDLAGITQLAMAIIQTSAHVELFDSRWIYCNGYGFIPSGPLIGWPEYQNCNSPFFSGSRLPFYAEPPLNPLRQRFANHTWIEVTNTAGDRTVLDPSHCLQATPNAPPSGTTTRDNYLAAATDPNRGPYVRTLSYNPASQSQQIGVTLVGTIPAFFTRSRGLTAEVDTTSPQMVNNASFDSATVLGIVREVVSAAMILDTDTTVGSAGSQVLITMSGFSKEQFNVEISNYEQAVDAVNEYNGAKQSLQTILPPDGFLPTAPLGDAAIRTACSVLFRRNAVVIRVFTGPLPDSSINQLSIATLRISKLLDAHVLSHAVQPGLETRPAPNLRGDPNISVAKGSKFSLHLDNVVDASAVRIAEVANYNVVLSAGVGNVDGTYSFYAVGEGKTLVKLCVAHEKNLSVSATEVWVAVTAGDDNAEREEKEAQGTREIVSR